MTIPPSVPPSVHDKKRRKNLAVFLLVIGWCVLIFLITMAKLVHSPAALHAPDQMPAEIQAKPATVQPGGTP